MSCLYQQLMEDARLRLRLYTMSCQSKSPNLLLFRTRGLCISPLSLVESERASLLLNWREKSRIVELRDIIQIQNSKIEQMASKAKEKEEMQSWVFAKLGKLLASFEKIEQLSTTS